MSSLGGRENKPKCSGRQDHYDLPNGEVVGEFLGMTCSKKGSQKHSYFIDPSECPKIVQMKGLETTILTGLRGEKMMMVLSATLPGHSVPLHSHPHEQIGMVYAGKAILRIGDEERLVEKGDFYCIPSNAPHGDTTVGDEPFIMLDVFYPVREDFVKRVGSSNR